MKKFLEIYHRSLLLKLIVFFLISLLVLFIFSDYFIDTFIHNTVIWYKVQTFRWFIIPFILTFFLFKMLSRPFSYYKKTTEEYQNVYKNYRLVVDNLIDDYFFYRHEPDKPFVYLSSSVSNVLGYNKNDFILKYKEIGAEDLFNNVFNRHYLYFNENLPIPPFEIKVINSNNDTTYLEIKEIPIFDEQKNIIAIEGIAKNITRQKIIENNLIEREKKYQIIFNSTFDGLLVIKDEMFIDCNQQILKIFDCTLEEIIMQTPFHYRFSPPLQPNGKSSRELAREKINLAYQGIPQHYEWIHLRNGKDPFPAEITLTKFTFENQDYILASVRDISERKQIINNLKEKEKKFKILYDNLPVGIIHLNTNKEILTINPAAENILTKNENYLLNDFIQQAFNILPNDLSSNSKYHVLELNHQSNIYTFSVITTMYKNNDESEYIILFEDITQNKQLLYSYKKQEQYFKEILENSRQILYKLNVETGNYEYISSALFDILGYTPEEFYQMNAEDIKNLIHPDDAINANSIVAKMISNINEHQNEFTIEYRFRHKNGSYVWLNDKYKIISNDFGMYIVGNIIEVTPLKEAEELIKYYRSILGKT